MQDPVNTALSFSHSPSLGHSASCNPSEAIEQQFVTTVTPKKSRMGRESAETELCVDSLASHTAGWARFVIYRLRQTSFFLFKALSLPFLLQTQRRCCCEVQSRVSWVVAQVKRRCAPGQVNGSWTPAKRMSVVPAQANTCCVPVQICRRCVNVQVSAQTRGYERTATLTKSTGAVERSQRTLTNAAYPGRTQCSLLHLCRGSYVAISNTALRVKLAWKRNA